MSNWKLRVRIIKDYLKIGLILLRAYPGFVYWQFRLLRRIWVRDLVCGIATWLLVHLEAAVLHFNLNSAAVMLGFLVGAGIVHFMDLLACTTLTEIRLMKTDSDQIEVKIEDKKL